MSTKNSSKMYSQDDVDEAVDRALAKRKERTDDSTGNDFADRVLGRLDDLGDKLDRTIDNETNKGKSSGGGLFGGDGSLESMLMFFDRLNIQSAANFAISICSKAQGGPIGTDNLPIGGGAGAFDPANVAYSSTVGRLIKWNVNQTVFLSRAIVAFMMFTVTLIKWEILDAVMGSGNGGGFLGGGSGGGGGFDISELFLFEMVSQGFGGSSASGGSSNPLDFLGGLFGGNSVVMDSTPYYGIV